MEAKGRVKTSLSFYAPIEDELKQVEEGLKGVVHTGMGSTDALVSHVVDVQGKRVRSAITLLTAKMLGCNDEGPVLMGTAVELLHLATLLHDDTVDNADVRRGRATLSSLEGAEVAVLVGDLLFAASAVKVCDTQNIRVIRRFSETIMDLSIGQLTERFMVNDWQQTRDQYMDRIYKKTGSLFATASESGAVLSDADEETIQLMRSFGKNLGIAFQVVDDILDFEGTAAEIGKPVGNDLATGTLTLPALLLVERYPENNPVVALCQGIDREENIKRAVDMMHSTGVIADAYAVAEELRSQANASLDAMPYSEYKQALVGLSNFVLARHV